MGKGGVFDLEKHFVFYGAHHTNPINIGAHMVCVWPNFFTSLVLLYFTPTLIHLPHSEHRLFENLALNFGLLYTLIYALFYICLDKKAGSLGALLCFACWVGASSVASRLSFSLAWKIVLVSQICGFTPQLIGHRFFEKRKPAFMDNFSVGFLMAPYFVLLEALQMVSDYEPYPGFNASVKAKIEADNKNGKISGRRKWPNFVADVNIIRHWHILN